MQSSMLYAGSHRRPHRTDPIEIALGIYAFCVEPLTGGLTLAGMTPTPQPGWIDLHPGGGFLYAVNEVTDFGGPGQGGISAFAIEPGTGVLTPLNSRIVGSNPCHCAVDATGSYLLVATNYGATVHLFRLEADGRIGAESDLHRRTGSGIHPRRQSQPHPHQVAIDPANRFVLVPDLGTDEIAVYELNLEGGKLIARPECTVRVAPGSGPRHVAFGSGARNVYLINELSATVMVFAYEAEGAALTCLQTVDLLPEEFAGQRIGGEIGVDPTGRWLYATTRSHGSSGEPPVRGRDALLWFEIDPRSGRIEARGQVDSGGEIPRSFCFDERGEHLLVGHQCTGTIVRFRLDPHNGTPCSSGAPVCSPVAVCLRFLART